MTEWNYGNCCIDKKGHDAISKPVSDVILLRIVHHCYRKTIIKENKGLIKTKKTPV